MDVDDLVLPAPDEIRRQDFHEPRQHDEIDLVLFEQLERLLLGDGAVRERYVVERQHGLARDGAQIGPVADDDDRLAAEPRRFREQSLQHVRLFRHQEGEPLRTNRREMNLHLHVQVLRGFADALLDRRVIEFRGCPRSLKRHAEVAACDLFLHRLDVGAELEKQLRDARDDAGFVVSDQRNGGDVFGHDCRLGSFFWHWRLICTGA